MAQGVAPQFSQGALAVLRERYLAHDPARGVSEEPHDMLRRVAEAVAAAARSFGDDPGYWRARFLERLERLEFLPNSPTLMNAGAPGGQLAACFVLPIEDDLGSIFSTLALAARIQQSGGGTGFSFSALRPRGERVRSTGGIASGPVSFMELFDHTTEVIRAGGRRRGANMGVLRVDHPDIEEFVEAKRTAGRLENFNLSVGMTDAFFVALAARAPFELRDPREGRVARRIDAEKLFDTIVGAAWETGDPGMIFLDEINRHNPTPALGAIAATNPCGEQPLLPYESCTLGSLNLAAFVGKDEVDWERLRTAIDDAVIFLDNVIEVNAYPAAEIGAATRRTRKIGLGVMGLADLLAELGIPYDSPQALALGERIAEFLTQQARARSAQLGEQRGAFPAFEQSVWPSRGFKALRNATVTCIAPTGTLSLLAGVSGGIEPFFALATARRLPGGQRIVEMVPSVRRMLAGLGPLREKALAAIREHGSLERMVELPETVRRRFPIALEMPPQAHLRMQAAFQKHVDAGVSKTVNLPPDAPPTAVREIFLEAHKLGLKGVTVYRYGSRPGQTLSLVDEQRIPDCRECAV
ncbi:MAG TPA: adenosylcobalamin-dependent ribonucleoside-diphosphate reductase [Candidatus Binataceae bacterium]|jgi:ribonucleoside-diphosphate reductase alpha chain|nr:adenosylcobalamin-dependent ribonucleoside-diphosphate reductase [Candidatus Binataceae bacterium]